MGAMRDKNAERHDSPEGDDGAYDGEEENSASDEAAQSSPRESDAGKLGVLPSNPMVHEALTHAQTFAKGLL